MYILNMTIGKRLDFKGFYVIFIKGLEKMLSA